jgi:hypothetical protein
MNVDIDYFHWALNKNNGAILSIGAIISIDSRGRA